MYMSPMADRDRNDEFDRRLSRMKSECAFLYSLTSKACSQLVCKHHLE